MGLSRAHATQRPPQVVVGTHKAGSCANPQIAIVTPLQSSSRHAQVHRVWRTQPRSKWVGLLPTAHGEECRSLLAQAVILQHGRRSAEVARGELLRPYLCIYIGARAPSADQPPSHSHSTHLRRQVAALPMGTLLHTLYSTRQAHGALLWPHKPELLLARTLCRPAHVRAAAASPST